MDGRVEPRGEKDASVPPVFLTRETNSAGQPSSGLLRAVLKGSNHRASRHEAVG